MREKRSAYRPRQLMERCEARQLMAITAPDQVTALYVTDSQNTPSGFVQWRDNANNETGYSVQRRIARSGERWVTIATLPSGSTEYLDVGRSNNRFVYRVAATSPAEISDWAQSNVVEMRGAVPTQNLNVAAPDLVSGSYIRNWQDTPSGLIKWRDNSNNESAFDVQRRIARAGETWVTIATLPANSTEYTDVGRANNKFAYRVRARNAIRLSDYVQTTTIVDARGPLSPEGLNLSFINTAARTPYIRMSWTARSTDESGFTLMRRRDNADVWRPVAQRNATTDTFIGYSDELNIRTGQPYQYYLITRRGSGDSLQTNASNIVSGTMPATVQTTIPPPANLRGSRSGNFVTLTWTDSSDYETGYWIQRRKVGETVWESRDIIGINAGSYTDQADPAFNWEYVVVTDAEGFVSDYSARITLPATT
jgi:hypothetical protein